MVCQNPNTDRLFEAILTLQSVEECYRFFSDACTIKELQEISGRFQVACALMAQKNYQQIAKETGVSTTTISRVNRSLQYGNDGYQMAIGRLKGEEQK